MALRKDPGPGSAVHFSGREVKGAKAGKHPGFVEPQLATLATIRPTAFSTSMK